MDMIDKIPKEKFREILIELQTTDNKVYCPICNTQIKMYKHGNSYAYKCTNKCFIANIRGI